ncbi:GNAT family N-acetyltransferase [Roseobacter sp. HKCCA0434]|uniref:GNAT family N-acetyltransferase n=1 Tax=Roseobacter sp. HKCCA0434 TaxID=3079297 RepID=UPI002905A8ED|nr:GNAT family N-acetyltransferase [Roseobacter sp. HKCCA0434]
MRIEILTEPTPAFAALVDRHVAFCDGTAPAESCHRLPVEALFGPDLTVWVAEDEGALMGMGGLKALPSGGGEIKSMHTVAEARGKGFARALLGAILAEAERRGYGALWLETGSHADFAAARGLYAAHGFTETGPFGDYVTDPHSVFMIKDMEAAR